MYLSYKPKQLWFILLIVLFNLILFFYLNSSYQSFSLLASVPSDNNIALNDINIQNFAFSPQNFEISMGDIVRWTNQDGVRHTATSNSSSPIAFDSGNLSLGQTFEFQFDQAGTYSYICTIHPSMQGQIIVSEASGTGETMHMIFLPNILN